MIKESEYSIKNVSSDSIVACVLGILALAAMIVAIITSYRYDGNGPAAVGLLGIASFIFSLCGIGFSVAAWKSADGGILMKRIVFIENCIPLLIALAFYCLGWIL